MPPPVTVAGPLPSEVLGVRTENYNANITYSNLAPLPLHGWDDEVEFMDAAFWENSYGNLDVGMDFDWTTEVEKFAHRFEQFDGRDVLD